MVQAGLHECVLCGGLAVLPHVASTGSCRVQCERRVSTDDRIGTEVSIRARLPLPLSTVDWAKPPTRPRAEPIWAPVVVLNMATRVPLSTAVAIRARVKSASTSRNSSAVA